ncbi:hypothetical protein QEZ40_001275 [Streptomyces katrae]|uniref:Knr4/Smi1-like domain-containing protein n=1 Tax=Streptomyces katrae TaxID=68223 RepID=A0ABT7GSS1_9ACTN|nr:hypothetical protein [Streptomyces katrae]MDK9496662.1 hypothetical protein [Streptomyces katrae]
MGAEERERKVYRPLRRAGLEVLPDAVPDGVMPFVGGYGREDVVGGFSHGYDTPGLVERLNEDWYDLAVSTGLFDHRREFLVMLPQGTWTHAAWLRNMHEGYHLKPPALWTRVRLLERWDVMGRGAGSAFLGVHAGHPGFGMMALDSSVYVICSTGERGVDVVAVSHPYRSETVLRHLERLAGWHYPGDNPEFRRRIAAWLAGRQRPATAEADTPAAALDAG